jgi:hypothetical protein
MIEPRCLIYGEGRAPLLQGSFGHGKWFRGPWVHPVFSNLDRPSAPKAWRLGLGARRWAGPAAASEHPAMRWLFLLPRGSSFRSADADRARARGFHLVRSLFQNVQLAQLLLDRLNSFCADGICSSCFGLINADHPTSGVGTTAIDNPCAGQSSSSLIFS